MGGRLLGPGAAVRVWAVRRADDVADLTADGVAAGWASDGTELPPGEHPAGSGGTGAPTPGPG